MRKCQSNGEWSERSPICTSWSGLCQHVSWGVNFPTANFLFTNLMFFFTYVHFFCANKFSLAKITISSQTSLYLVFVHMLSTNFSCALYLVFIGYFECLRYPNNNVKALLNQFAIYIAILLEGAPWQFGLRTRHILVVITVAYRNATHSINLHHYSHDFSANVTESFNALQNFSVSMKLTPADNLKTIIIW